MRSKNWHVGTGLALLLSAGLSCTLGAATASAQESFVEIVTAVEQRGSSSLDVRSTRDAIAALEDPLHRCFWSRKTADFTPGYESHAVSEWRIRADEGKRTVEIIPSQRAGVIEEKAVLRCFEKELAKVKLASGQARVLLSFKPKTGLNYPRTKVSRFRFVGKKPTPRLASMLKNQVLASRDHLCASSNPEPGTEEIKVTIRPNGSVEFSGSERAYRHACALGLTDRQTPIHLGPDPIEFTVRVEEQVGPDRRPFEARRPLDHLTFRLPEGTPVRYQTAFGDTEVWRTTGMTSTNRLRSVCLVAAEQLPDERFVNACQFAGCECATEFYDENWGAYCQPYIDAGRPPKLPFIEAMFRKKLEEHRAALDACGAQCQDGAKNFAAECGAFLGGQP